MSGSAGGNRVTRQAVEKTVNSYIEKVLKKFKAFKDAKISGSYNTGTKEDFGDIDLIVTFEGDDKKVLKKQYQPKEKLDMQLIQTMLISYR